MPRSRHDPVRSCVGCRREASKRELLRVVRRPDGIAAFDPSGRAPGRGAYLHPDGACVEAARRRRALERSLRAQVSPQLWTDLQARLQ